MSQWGLVPEDFAQDDTPPLALWPETAQALGVFLALGTQWRVGMAGATGLDYAVIPVTLRLLGIPRAEWTTLFEDMRVMERAALKTMRT